MKTTLCLLLSILFVTGCKLDNSPTDSKEGTALQHNDTLSHNNNFWGYAKNNLELSDNQIKRLKKVNIKSKKRIKYLKKSKKWFGKKNLANRKNHNRKVEMQIKEIIPAKYSKFKRVQRNWKKSKENK